MTDAEKVTPWVAAIKGAIREVGGGEDPYLFAALMLRESGAGLAPGYEPKSDPCGWGDQGYGYGLFQIDKRFHQQFIESEGAKTAWGQATYALRLLKSNRRLLRVLCHVPDLLERATYAAYNCGAGRVLRALRFNKNPDDYTTGKDYAAWIWKRADALRRSAPGLFT